MIFAFNLEIMQYVYLPYICIGRIVKDIGVFQDAGIDSYSLGNI